MNNLSFWVSKLKN